MTDRLKEVTTKERRIRELLAKMDLEGLCLSKALNFAWFTAGGNNRVVTGSETGAAALVILPEGKFVVAPKNEIERIMEEQVPDLDFNQYYSWHQRSETAANFGAIAGKSYSLLNF